MPEVTVTGTFVPFLLKYPRRAPWASEPRHFHLHIHPKDVFWQVGGVQELVVKAFLMEVEQTRRPEEGNRRPTGVSPEEAKRRLAEGREVRYSHQLETVIDRALERIQFHQELWGTYSGARGAASGAAMAGAV